MSELDPNDKRLIATEYFDRALGPEELAWFEENGLAVDPVVKETLEDAAALRQVVRRGPRPEPPAVLDFYWQRVKAEVARGGAPRTRTAGNWLGWVTPLRGLAVAATVLLATVWFVPHGGALLPKVERAESRQPGLYTSIVPSDGASVVWITGLDYLPEGYVLR